MKSMTLASRVNADGRMELGNGKGNGHLTSRWHSRVLERMAKDTRDDWGGATSCHTTSEMACCSFAKGPNSEDSMAIELESAPKPFAPQPFVARPSQSLAGVTRPSDFGFWSDSRLHFLLTAARVALPESLNTRWSVRPLRP